MYPQTKIFLHKTIKTRMLVFLTAITAAIAANLYAAAAMAEGVVVANNIGDVAGMIVGSFYNIGRLMIATSYLAGIGFTIGAIFKFKQHRDNPTQIPIGTPIALLGLGVILIFLPGIIGPVGETLFGTGNLSSYAGGFTGKGANNLPGGQ